MSITKAIHIQCDACGRWLRDANSGPCASRQAAISYASIKGWTHDQRDLCPVCLRRTQSLLTLALAQGAAASASG